MSDLCPTCRLPLWFDGEQFQDGVHCANSPALHIQTCDELECCRLGIEARDRQLAAGVRTLKVLDALLVRAREVLVETEAKVTAALEQLDREAPGG